MYTTLQPRLAPNLAIIYLPVTPGQDPGYKGWPGVQHLWKLKLEGHLSLPSDLSFSVEATMEMLARFPITTSVCTLPCCSPGGSDGVGVSSIRICEQ